MVTIIEIVEGPQEGSRFKIVEGLTLGRSGADIIIKDPKVSGVHAKVSIDGKGQLVLLDLDSSNGLHINGRRVKKVALLQGVMFEVGRTLFKVASSTDEVAKTLFFEQLQSWRLALKSSLSSLTFDPPSKTSPLIRLSPALRLKFTQGIQTDQEFILGYGPRIAGSDCLDIDLLEDSAPKKAFEIIPKPGLAEIKVHAIGKVTLNQKSVETEILSDGDVIAIGNTLIKVSYL